MWLKEDRTQSTYSQFYESDRETFLFRRTVTVSNQGHLDSNATAWSGPHVDIAVTTNDELEAFHPVVLTLGSLVSLCQRSAHTYRIQLRDTLQRTVQLPHTITSCYMFLKVEQNVQLSLVRRHVAAAAAAL